VKTENRKLKTENFVQSEPTPFRRLKFEGEEEEEEEEDG
jgi:hypothetical protein